MKFLFNKRSILKWISESLLIIISVFLAFYFENIRQSRNEKQKLISGLKELRESIVTDTVVFYNKGRALIPGTDSSYLYVLSEIKKKGSATEIFYQIRNADYNFSYKNWVLERMIESDALNSLGSDFKNPIWYYYWQYFSPNNNEVIFHENNNKAIQIIFSKLKFKNDFEKMHGFGNDHPLMRYKEISDSSVVYSDEIKNLVIHNMVLLALIKEPTITIQSDGASVIKHIDRQIKELE